MRVTDSARWCFNQYFAELNWRFEGSFDPGLSISAGPQELTLPMGFLLLARLTAGLLVAEHSSFIPRRPAELKGMWIAPAARGLGIGRRLLSELEGTAREVAVVVLRLETNRALSEAIVLYKRSGYFEFKAFNDEPTPTIGSKKRLGRKRKVGECSNRD